SMTREQVVRGFSESSEYQINTADRSGGYSFVTYAADWGDEVYRLYRATLDRDPDATGFAAWAETLAGGRDYLSVVTGFTASQEFQNVYGNTTDTQFIELLYNNVLNRGSDATGLAGWLNQLQTAAMTRSEVVRGFAESQEHINSTASAMMSWLQSSAGGGDILEGGAGNDTLTGGVSGDRFVFSGDFGTDTIINFDPAGGDLIDFSQTTLDFTDLTITDVAGGVVRITTPVGTINLQTGATGLTAAQLTQSAFLFSGGAGKASNSYSNSGDGSKVEGTGLGSGSIQVQSNQANSLIGMDQFRADATFGQYNGAGMTVVVIDTGIDLNHSAFGPDANGDGISDRIVYHADFSGDRDGTADDVQGHGSNVASIIGSSNSSYLGVAPGVNIIALQALSNDGRGSITGIEAALDWVIQNGSTYNVVAVNMSLGPGDNVNTLATNAALGDEYAALYQQGIITNLAAGNDYFQYQTAGVSSLAADPSVMAVGAVWAGDFGRVDWGSGAKDFTSATDRVTSFSQRSDTLPNMIFAPGAMIDGAAPGGGFAAMGGTSQATPVISGMVAIAQQVAQDLLGRHLTPEEFRSMVRSTATTINDGDNEDDNVVNLNANVPRANMLALAQAIQAMAGSTPTTDDFAGDSTTTGRLTIGGAAAGNIETGTDQDWFAVQLTAGTDYRFDLTGNSLSDPVLALLDANGQVMASNDDFGGTRNSQIGFTAQTTGTYYLSAQSYGSGTGTYALNGVATGVVITDDFAGDSSTTGTIAVGGSTSGNIETAGDRDWFAVTLQARTEYQIALAGQGGGALTDTYLRIYDAAGNELASNDDYSDPNRGWVRDSQLLFTPTSGGTYYVGAASYADSLTGTYVASVATTAVSGDVPEDATTTATVSVGGFYDGRLDPAGDRDWVAVNLSGGTVYDIMLSGRGTDPVRDTYLRIYDANGNQVGGNDDYSGLDSRLPTFSVNASGRYFIEAASYGDNYAGDYRIDVSAAGGSTGDTAGDSSTTSTIAVGGSVQDTIDVAGDRDWHQVNVQAGHSYRINLDGSGSSALSDPYLRVYDSNSSLIAQDDDGGSGLNSELIYTASRTGTLYLSAAAYGDGRTGTYTLGLADLGSVDDYSGDSSTAGTVAGGGSVTGSIEQAGDHDWFAFQVQAGGIYQFDLVGAGGTPLGDTVLAVRDAYGTMLGYDDDGGTGRNSQLLFSAPASGTLYLDVSGYSSSYTGGYQLSTTVISSGNDDYADDRTTTATLPSTGSLSGNIETLGDRDMFAVNLQRGGTYDFAATGGTLSDTTLSLYDEYGNLVGYNDDSNGSFNSLISGYVAQYSGRYYLGVASYGDYLTGTYTVSSTQTGSPVGGSDDYGDTTGTAGLISANSSVTGNLETVGDRDWVGIDVLAGDQFLFTLTGVSNGGGTLADPVLNLYDSNGTLAASNDDWLGRDSQLNLIFGGSGTYYLEARAYADAYSGTWTLTAELL
ncbi:MAG: pre-peptidase C-terminal domain-containing protein, partial [Roseivivax sp.]|nr:pre-peptidase C-terminal domain-containing protein [Roseivivax sp.]